MTECQSTSGEAENTPTQKQRKTWPNSTLRPRRSVLVQAARRREAQEALLAAYERLGTIMGAADEVGIARANHYEWLANDEDYAEMWLEAQEASTQVLEKEAVRRATAGAEKGVYYQGVRVGEERSSSDVLLIFLLKSRRPDVYRDRYEVTGAGSGPIQVQAMRPDALSRLSDAQLDALAALNGTVVRSLAAQNGVKQADIITSAVVEPPSDGSTGDTADEPPEPAF